MLSRQINHVVVKLLFADEVLWLKSYGNLDKLLTNESGLKKILSLLKKCRIWNIECILGKNKFIVINTGQLYQNKKILNSDLLYHIAVIHIIREYGTFIAESKLN